MNLLHVFDCSTSQFVALFGVNEVKRPPVTFARSSFMNFIVFQLKLIKFKPKIKFIKFELHNYGLQAVINTDHDPCDPYSCSVHLQQFVCDSVTLVSFIHSFIHKGVPRIFHWGQRPIDRWPIAGGVLGEGVATPSHHLWVSGAL